MGRQVCLFLCVLGIVLIYMDSCLAPLIQSPIKLGKQMSIQSKLLKHVNEASLGPRDHCLDHGLLLGPKPEKTGAEKFTRAHLLQNLSFKEGLFVCLFVCLFGTWFVPASPHPRLPVSVSVSLPRENEILIRSDKDLVSVAIPCDDAADGHEGKER